MTSTLQVFSLNHFNIATRQVKHTFSFNCNFHLPDNVIRDYRANGLKAGDSMTAKFPMTNDATGQTFPVSVHDYFTKFGPYKVPIKYPW